MRRRQDMFDRFSPVTLFTIFAAGLLLILILMEMAADFGKL